MPSRNQAIDRWEPSATNLAESRVKLELRLMDYREEIARQQGFQTFAELLDVSKRLPREPGEKVETYLARKPGGYWFLGGTSPSQSPRRRNRRTARTRTSLAASRSGFGLVDGPKHSEGRDLNGLDFRFAPFLFAQIQRELYKAGNGCTVTDALMNARLKGVIQAV